ncbi:MAG: DUF1573 domain-containing protein [Opitutales bacterium]
MTRFVLIPSLLLPVLAGGMASAWGKLVFEQTVAEPEVTLADTFAEAQFRFTNTYDFPVTVTEIRTSCGCTTADFDFSEVYAPGASGLIPLRFEFGARTGNQVKTAMVRSDAPEAGPIQLQLRVEIPALVRVEPRSLLWLRSNSGDSMEAKSATISIHPEADLRVTSVRSYNPNFAAELVAPATPEVGGTQTLVSTEDTLPWTLKVTPTTEIRRGAGKIEVTAADAEGKPHRVTLYAIVR